MSRRIHITSEEAHELLCQLVDLRNKLPQSKIDYDNLLSKCVNEFDFLIERKARKYRRFPNYEDLKQDGRIALLLSLNSYNPDKGDFFFWANQYIKTKLSREANRHSTIKIPIKKAKLMQPYKVSQIPIMTDTSPDPLGSCETDEIKNHVGGAIGKLPKEQQQVIKMHFEFTGMKSNSIAKICKELNISRSNCMKLLNEAKVSLKENLESFNAG